MYDLKGKTAVVTGGGSGIGASISRTFAQHQALVVILDMDEKGAGKVVEEIKAAGGEATFLKCNVSDSKQVKDAFEVAYNLKSCLDIVVNNAGIAHVGTVETTSEEDFDRIYQVNVKGVYNCLKSAVEWMKKSGGGAILNLASIASVIGLPDRFAYSMSKGAVLTMTYSVARDFINDGIRCNCIAPGRVHTPFVDNFIAKNYPGKEEEMMDKLAKTQPIGRMGKPDEIAHLALYLCSDESSFITGTNYPIDGGFITLNT